MVVDGEDATRTTEKDPDAGAEWTSSASLGSLGARLLTLRRDRGSSQQQVAAALGVAVSSYAGWERAELGPRFEQLVALADFFGVTLDDLVGRRVDDASAFSRSGVSWRLAWSRPSVQKQRAASVWEQLVSGRSRSEIARAEQVGEGEVDRQVQDLVLGEWLEVEQVAQDEELEEGLRQHFLDVHGYPRLREVRVAKLGHIDSSYARFVLLGHAAKLFLGTRKCEGALKPGMSLGLCGGFSVSRLVHAYRRGELPAGIRVVPIGVTPVFERAGVSANSVVSALAYRHFDHGVEAIELSFLPHDLTTSPPSPAWRIARRVLDDAARVDIAVLGLGGPDRGALARDISEMQRDLQWLAQVSDLSEGQPEEETVGNILYQLVGPNGEPRFQAPTERLVCSIGLGALQGMVETGRRVVALGVGAEKAAVARAAIVAGYANVVIVDDALAEAILQQPT